jgi:anaerobic dimethyl sulfoxide reductase subunit B (iron-sulfur subunit)
MAKQYAFYFDANACNGCKVCVIACKSKNSLPVGINWRRVYEYEGGSWVPHPDDPTIMLPANVFAYAISAACMHCEKATCVDICPTGAMMKRADGIVLIDADKCIGCRYCEWACPYSAPQFNEETGKMTKCDFCVDQLDSGGKPFCVESCVMRALDFGELDELKAKYGEFSAVEPLPVTDITKPSFVMTPHRHAQVSGVGTGRITDAAMEG